MNPVVMGLRRELAGFRLTANEGGLAMKLRSWLPAAVIVLLPLVVTPELVRAENRTIDGTGNNVSLPSRGAANTPFIRNGYKSQFFGTDAALPTETQRANARDISNAISAQSASVPSARHLSNYIWAWGQFLTHDTDLSTTSNGPTVNGTAPIAIHLAADPLGPNAIPFTRANFSGSVTSGERTPINEITTFIDGSNVYGSNATRAAALRTDGGLGAKLVTDAGDLLPRNTAGLPNENNGPLPANQLFLAGDIRSNENSLLTSLHTIFAREHNRLIDLIRNVQPGLNDEQQYQLARQLVGAEVQAITYRGFLPALLGNGATVPKAEQYLYNAQTDPSITTAFSHAAFRFGHSAVTSQLRLVDASDAAAGSLAIRDMFYNPNLIGNDPTKVDQLLRGAATQHSEEVDALVVDDLRNFLFGPPGAGGLDLASLNIQRGRDAGLPSVNNLGRTFNFSFISSFSQLTSDPNVAQALSTLYGNVENMDMWVAGLAQDHAADASVGAIFKGIIENQFRRLRDGDRLFYRGTSAGLYNNGTLNPAIAAIVDLDRITLADVIEANTSIAHLQENVFFVPTAGDFNGDGKVDAADYVVWRSAAGTANVWVDADGNGMVGPEDLSLWRANFGVGIPPIGGASLGEVPEPSAIALAWVITPFALTLRRVHRRAKHIVMLR
jgi:Animal haem peroxidase